MNNRYLATCVAMAGVVLLLPLPAVGQEIPLQTPWGDPNLQGVWTGSTLTPVERPLELAGKDLLTEEEVAELERQASQARLVERAPRDNDPGTYNQIWFDPGTRVVGDRRTSLIVEPPNGRIPYHPEMHERQRLQRAYRTAGQRDSWVDVDTGERCMSDGLPMLWLGYNPNHQIVQTPDHVVILHEMFRDRRIIPLDGGPHAEIRQWNGDIRGRWEGDTLVVETTHFVDKTQYRWANAWRMPTETMRVVERFRRVDEKTLDYELTIEDPAKFTRPWTISNPLTTDQASRGVTQGPVYEYACHEGNYSLQNVLSGARAEEKPPSQSR
jgi:hypothetical protein